MQIRRLKIENFRSIGDLEWMPSPGVNCLIGPGDTGKTSLLDAVALLLAPYAIGAANELDYRERDISRGFRIEAVLCGLRDEPFIQQKQIPPLRGWKDGKLTPLPDEAGAEPALVCEVAGDASLDLNYSILPLDGEPIPFTVSLRRKLALARISAADRANRDLRLGTGSLLARYFRGPSFGGALTEAVRVASDDLKPPHDMDQKFAELKTTFGTGGLPENLQFGLLPAIGWSLAGMVALSTGQSPSTAIPVANAGTGTRNLALLEVAAAMSAESPIVVIDEPEHGLEPYRQRRIGTRLTNFIGERGQAFATTHAPAFLSALQDQAIWHLASPGRVRCLDTRDLKRVLREHPDAFFARLPVLCEGPTEIGLLSVWLPSLLESDLAALGVELVNGQGQPNVLKQLKAFSVAEIPVAGFLDNEEEYAGTRTTLADQIPMFIWDGVKDIEDAIATHLPLDQLNPLVEFAAELNGTTPSNYCARIRDKLKDHDDSLSGLTIDEFISQRDDVAVRKALATVMSKTGWFKSVKNGAALAHHLKTVGLPEPILDQLDVFGSKLRVRLHL